MGLCPFLSTCEGRRTHSSCHRETTGEQKAKRQEDYGVREFLVFFPILFLAFVGIMFLPLIGEHPWFSSDKSHFFPSGIAN